MSEGLVLREASLLVSVAVLSLALLFARRSWRRYRAWSLVLGVLSLGVGIAGASLSIARFGAFAVLATRGIAGYIDRACALDRAGKLFCWRRGPREAIEAKPFLGDQRITQVLVGEAHRCAVTDTGAIYCWGWNAWGQLGDGTTDDRETPIQVTEIGPAVGIAARGATTCAVHTNGAVSCWGQRFCFE